MPSVRIDSVYTVYYIDSSLHSEDYRNARNGGEWIIHAVDRMRFNTRIKLCEKSMSGIFEPGYRATVFRARFADTQSEVRTDTAN